MPHDKLLPCPFCGGEANGNATVTYCDAMVKKQKWDQATYYYCNCIMCGVQNMGMVGHKTREQAIEAWNRRAPCDEDRTPQFDAKRMGMR